VLAESCTCGLIAAKLGGVPGVSQWLVGSLVSYRLDAKQRWLGVPSKWLEPQGPGAVSQPVAEAMAEGALRCAPEAQVALAITGHLGPGAPLQQDGLVWIAASGGGRSLLEWPISAAIGDASQLTRRPATYRSAEGGSGAGVGGAGMGDGVQLLNLSVNCAISSRASRSFCQ
jgi:PncC family amidohydrolase